MARQPFVFYDRFGRVMQTRVSRAAIGSPQRANIAGFDRDTAGLFCGTDRRLLMSFGRLMYENNPVVRGIVDDMSEVVSADIDPHYVGDEAEWGAAAWQWMNEHNAICDVRGEPYTMQALRRLWFAHCVRDGDVGIILTRGAGGYPLLQTIPAHRIRGDGIVGTDSPWAGRRIMDGVIINDYGRPLAYRVYDDSRETYTDISAVDMKLKFRPMYADQIRGVSPLGASLINFQDVEETRRFEMIAQKLAASIVLSETNEIGAPMSTDETAFSGTETNAQDFEMRKMEGGEILYFRSGTGGKLEALRADRPTASQQTFIDSVLRQAIAGMGWSIDYFLDPSKVGGASMRVVVERVNRRVRGFRSEVLFPLCRTLDAWRLSVAMKIGLIPQTNNPFAWRYTGAADLTADAKYQADVARSHMDRGLMSPIEACASLGRDWEDVQDQSIQYWQRLQERCKEAGIDPSLVATVAGTTYQLMPAVQPDPDAIPQPGAPGGQPLPETEE